MSIYARTLAETLHDKGKTLGSLYTVRVGERPIPAIQIMRLQRAVTGGHAISVTLNPEQMDAVSAKFQLTPDDLHRLKVAIMAESQFRMLADRIAPDDAYQLADALYQLLLDADEGVLSMYGLNIELVRADEDLQPGDYPQELTPEDQRVVDAMDAALDLYDEAILWIERACSTLNHVRRAAYAALAHSLLDEATTSVQDAQFPATHLRLRDEWLPLLHDARGATAQLANGSPTSARDATD